MLLHFEEDIQIARGTAVGSRLALTGHAQARAGIDSCGHAHFERAFAFDTCLAAAGLASLADHLSRTLACRAGARDREESLLVGHLSAAAAGLACSHAAAGFSARSLAGFAVLAADQPNLGAHAGCSILKAERHVVAQIGAPLAPGGAASSPSAPTEGLVKAEQIAQNVVKLLKNHGIEAATLKSPAAQSSVSEAVVDRALLGIGQNGVGFRGHPEIDLGFFFVLRIAIGMPFERGFAIGRFDLVGRRITLDAKNHVIVRLGIRRHCSLLELLTARLQ